MIDGKIHAILQPKLEKFVKKEFYLNDFGLFARGDINHTGLGHQSFKGGFSKFRFVYKYTNHEKDTYRNRWP